MARRRPLRITYAAIDGGRSYRQQALDDQDGRYRLLLATVEALVGEGVDLLVFPAGYFQVRNERALANLVRRLRLGLRGSAPDFGLVVGVDRMSTAYKTEHPKREHPYFALYRTTAGAIVSMQQVSVTRQQGAVLDLLDARWGARELLLAETEIAFLICGESWSDELLDRVVVSGCRALVVAAHRTVNLHTQAGGYGRLSWHRRFQALCSERELPVVLSEHTRSPHRHPYSWPADISDSLAPDGVPDGVTLRLATITT